HAGHLQEEAGSIPRIGLDELVDALAVEREQRGFRLGLDGGRALGLVTEEAHLPEAPPGLEAVQDLLDASADFLGDEDDARTDEEQLLAGIAFAKQHLALAQPPLAQPRPQGDELRFVQVAQEIDLAEEGDVGRLRHWLDPPYMAQRFIITALTARRRSGVGASPARPMARSTVLSSSADSVNAASVAAGSRTSSS